MAIPEIVKLEEFPATVTLHKTRECLESDAYTSGPYVRSGLAGTIVVRFSLQGTNLSFAGDKKTIETSGPFAKGEARRVSMSWALRCPAGTDPMSTIELLVTAEYTGGAADRKSAPIEIKVPKEPHA